MPKTNQQPIQTARILLEALPYIRQYQGATLAIKYGGHAMVDENLKQSFAQDLILMKLIGMNPLVVHGGGPQINRVLERIGKESVFVDGMRVTDTETMDVVEMVLGGLVNKEIVKLINSLGGQAVGLTGKDGNLIKACKLKNKNRNPSSGKEGTTVDFGQVGEVESIDPSIINVLLSRDFIPVIAPTAAG
ncbi:MAG: acetylglutamate kinase, partial [Gammaproteobacteria bacterium]|nr:acetylglutamate kinase [Gammaproteobacteria bacterium]